MDRSFTQSLLPAPSQNDLAWRTIVSPNFQFRVEPLKTKGRLQEVMMSSTNRHHAKLKNHDDLGTTQPKPEISGSVQSLR